jgi:hypothetical protein
MARGKNMSWEEGDRADRKKKKKKNTHNEGK